MAIQFTCPSCRQPIEVDDELANRQARCPYCQTVVTVPSRSAMEAGVPEARPGVAPSASPGSPGPSWTAASPVAPSPSPAADRLAGLSLWASLFALLVAIIGFVLLMVMLFQVLTAVGLSMGELERLSQDQVAFQNALMQGLDEFLNNTGADRFAAAMGYLVGGLIAVGVASFLGIVATVLGLIALTQQTARRGAAFTGAALGGSITILMAFCLLGQ